MSAEFRSTMGTTGTPPFSAILKLPSRKGRKVSFTRLRVPSGKMQRDTPRFTSSTPARMVFSPSLILSLSRNRQWIYRIQSRSRGYLSISFLATYPVMDGKWV